MVTSTRSSTEAEEPVCKEKAPGGSIFQDLANSELASFVPDWIKLMLLKSESIAVGLV